MKFSEELGVRSEELNAPRQWNGPHFHLIHRGAVPLPLEGKDNTRGKLRRDCKRRARHLKIAASEALPHLARPERTLLLSGVKAFPS